MDGCLDPVGEHASVWAMPGIVDLIRRDHHAKKRRLASFQEALNALTSEERAEVLADLLDRVEAERTDNDAGTSSHKRTRRSGRRVAKRHARSLPALTLREAAMKALRGGKKLGAGQLHKAMLKIKPDTNYGSLLAELARMQSDKVLVKAGSHSRGALYGLANEHEEGAASE
jgi:hypothetical protein